MNQATVKKPIRTEGEQPLRCYCNHSEHAHPCKEECGCKVFQPRPCVCGHHHANHCTECVCRRYREDRSPEFLLRQGIRAGEWGIAALPRLQALMRPEQDAWVRIWACLAIHVMDRQGQPSQKRNRGRLVMHRVGSAEVAAPMSPHDVMNELNALDTVPRLDKHEVRRNLRELERWGMVRVVGNTRKHTHILLYARPLKFRTLAPLIDPDLGGRISPQLPPSPTSGNYLREALFLPLRATLVKSFSRTLRAQMEAAGLTASALGAESDPQNLIAQSVDELLLGVQIAYQKLLFGVGLAPQTSDAYIKERARASSIYPVIAGTEKSSSSETPETQKTDDDAKQSPSAPKPKTEDWDVAGRAAAEYCPVDDNWVQRMKAACQKRCPDITAAEVAQLIHMKGKQATTKSNPAGFLLTAVPNLCEGESFRRIRTRILQQIESFATQGDQVAAAAAEKEARWRSEQELDRRTDEALASMARAELDGRKAAAKERLKKTLGTRWNNIDPAKLPGIILDSVRATLRSEFAPAEEATA